MLELMQAEGRITDQQLIYTGLQSTVLFLVEACIRLNLETTAELKMITFNPGWESCVFILINKRIWLKAKNHSVNKYLTKEAKNLFLKNPSTDYKTIRTIIVSVWRQFGNAFTSRFPHSLELLKDFTHSVEDLRVCKSPIDDSVQQNYERLKRFFNGVSDRKFKDVLWAK